MAQPDFWNNSDKAQQTIQQLKILNGVLRPMQEMEAAAQDAGALAELAEEEPSLDAELDKELLDLERKLDDFELQSMLSGSQDASNAYLRIQAGSGGTEACDWAQMLMRMYARWAEEHGEKIESIDELRKGEEGIRSEMLSIFGYYAVSE